MDTQPLPTLEQVQAQLAPLKHAEIQQLSLLSGVPFPTLWHIRCGTSKNPGIVTLGKFYHRIGEAVEIVAKRKAASTTDRAA